MLFYKKGDIYKISRATSSKCNLLGVKFRDVNTTVNDIEVIEWSFPEIFKHYTEIRTSKTELLTQIISGLNSMNQALGTNYTLSHVYYVPLQDPSGRIYRTLIRSLIRHFHNGNEFKE
jgi:hypothetical protein